MGALQSIVAPSSFGTPNGDKSMCGIVGIVGRRPVSQRLLDALKRLEYRGYDSAGVATISEGTLERCRAQGKLVNLEMRLKQQPLDGIIGIGHTRWATHAISVSYKLAPSQPGNNFQASCQLS